MTVPAITAASDGSSGAPLLILGPSLGTAAPLWDAAAQLLCQHFSILSWDLPGHGLSRPASEPFTVAELGDAVIALADERNAHRFAYAGVSLGGAVGLELALRHPERLLGVSAICSVPAFGDPGAWLERAELVRKQSTSALVDASARRWFGPDFVATNPAVASALLYTLSDTDDQSYALCCEALAGYDVRGRLGEIGSPLLALSGQFDLVAPPSIVEAMAAATQRGRAVEVADAGHLAPAEQPNRVAALLTDFFTKGSAS
jgi:3-oxoadipate enol-lactonase